jgi:hypothetical protein
MRKFFVIAGLVFLSITSFAQNEASVSARIDAKQIMVGDQVRLFLEAQYNPSAGRLQWATIPDSFNNLEVVDKGKIDTLKQGDVYTYRQRLLITGFDSGFFKIPSFVFSVIPNSGIAYTEQTDSFYLLVQTVPVDTTKGFMGIKGIMKVKSTWLDYIWYIVGGIVFLVLLVFVILYFLNNRKNTAGKPKGPSETLQEYTLRLLAELQAKQLWQKKQVKAYYVELTDIVRNYIEDRFRAQAMELTTDELLSQVQTHKDLMQYYTLIAVILHTADLAKFAKAEPLPEEHIDAMDKARLFVQTTMPVEIAQETTEAGAIPSTDNTTTNR